MKRCAFFITALFILSITAPAQSAKRPMTVDDALNLIGIGNVRISPDGEWVFFSKSELDWEKNKRRETFFMVPFSGGPAFRYIGEAGGSDFRFSPDGKSLALKRTVEEKSQIFLMRTGGGEAIQLTKHKSPVGSYRWSPDGRRIIFSAQKIKSKEQEKKIKDGDDVIFVDEGPNGQSRGEWLHLWSIDLESKKESPILEQDLLIRYFDISPCGNKLLFTARTSNRRNDEFLSEIYLLDLTEGKPIRLTDNQAPEHSPLWSPDGKSCLFLASDNQAWLNRNTKIWRLDLETRKTDLLSGKFEGSIRGTWWSPDGKTVYFNGQQGANAGLFALDPAGGNIRALTPVPGTLRVGDLSRDRTRMAYVFSDFDSPGDVYAARLDDFEPVRLTDVNPWVEKDLQLASMQLIQWDSVKGMEIEGLLHLPADTVPGTRLPLILNIHGGPAGCFTNSFRASYHIHAGLGYASLSPNVRGSSGYTDRLREGNTVSAGDGIGMGDYWDLMKGIDAVIQRGIADPDRLAVKGWSYGGILGGWTISHTDRFKAASLGAGVYDWPSEYGPGFNYDVRLWHIGGTPWENPKAWRERSTYHHVEKIVTPTLLIHGMRDSTDTESQSMLLFTAIKDIGKAPVRYLRVPREPHGFREPRHQRARDIEEIRWFQKHVAGIDWKPWERAESKKESDQQADTKKAP
jgi:dipeptidyl aminopeptidase/acylaminoacyl peptidase